MALNVVGNIDNVNFNNEQYTTYKKDEMPDLYDQVIQLLKKVGIDHFNTENKEWIVWCTTQQGVERFTSLYQGAKETGLL